MTKELMDRYKAGELGTGYYWAKDNKGEIYLIFMRNGKIVLYDNIIDILASVPSYEEWADVSKNFDDVVNANHQLCEDRNALENKLKKLEKQLEIAKDALKYYCNISPNIKYGKSLATVALEKIEELEK